MKTKFMSLAMAFCFMLSAVLPTFKATAYASDDTVELMNASVEAKTGNYTYDVELTFKVPGLTFDEVYGDKPVRDFDDVITSGEAKSSDPYSELKLNNNAKDKCAFFGFTDADVEFYNGSQAGTNKYKFKVLLSDVEYDGIGNTIEVDADFMIKVKDADEDDGYRVVEYSTDGYVRSMVDGDYDSDEKERPDDATPHIIVSEYQLESSQLQAGVTVPLNIMFTNTSTRLDLENIIMKVSTSAGLSIINSSNTFYIKEMDAKETLQQAFDIMVLPNADDGVQTVTISFDYEYVTTKDVRTKSTSEEVVSVNVVQKDRFTAMPPKEQPQIYPGEETIYEFEYINKGRTDIYNLTAEISGNIDKPNQFEYIGNVPPGKTDTVDFIISSTEGGAELAGTVTFTYEDSVGNVKTAQVPFATNVIEIDTEEMMQPDIPFPDMDPNEEGSGEEEGLTLKQKLIYGGVGAVVLIAAISYAKKKRREKEFEDDDEDI